jgi:hypothetical protein
VLVVFFLIWGAFYADRMAIQSPATPPWSQEEVSLNNLIWVTCGSLPINMSLSSLWHNFSIGSFPFLLFEFAS